MSKYTGRKLHDIIEERTRGWSSSASWKKEKSAAATGLEVKKKKLGAGQLGEGNSRTQTKDLAQQQWQ